MAITQDRQPLTLQVPLEVFNKVRESAKQSNRSPEREAVALLELALRERHDLQELIDRARAEYDEYLAKTGQKRPTVEETLLDLRRIREEIADALDPQ